MFSFRRKKNWTKRKLLKQFKKYSMLLSESLNQLHLYIRFSLYFALNFYNIFFLKGKINPHFPFKNNFKLHSSKQWPLQYLWWQNQKDLNKISNMQVQKVPYISNFNSLQTWISGTWYSIFTATLSCLFL